MQLEWWHIGGLLMGIGQAAYLVANQHLRIEPRLLMFWRGFGIALLLLPAALWFNNWPTNWQFYAAAGTAGLLIGIFDRMAFQAALHYGAGVTSRLLSLALPIAFVMWLALHPGHIGVLMDKPNIWLLPVALIGTLASVLLLKRSAVSKAAVLGLVPLYFMGAALDILNKTAMMYGNGMPSFIAYGVITSFAAGCMTLLWPTRGGNSITLRHVFSIWRGGMIIVLIGGAYILLKTSSLNNAPNPAFITALNLTGPFWVMIWNKWQQHPDDSNIWAGTGCVISALLLVFATL